MSEPKIENLQELISQYVGPQKKIVNSKLFNLTAPGENYWSSMFGVDLTLKNLDGDEEKFYAVAKCVIQDELDNKPHAHDSSPLFRNELAFYTEIIPILTAFQREQGMIQTNIFPKLYGKRCNLKENSQEIDRHAVLLLENLKVSGYKNADRHIGFTFEEAKFILKDLAVFHAVPLALKLKKPYVFEEKIKANIKRPERPPNDKDPGGPPEGKGPGGPPEGKGPGGPPEGKGPGGPPGGPPQLLWFEELKDHPTCKPYIEILKKKAEKKPGAFFKRSVNEPFATLCHDDMWTNNSMQKYERDQIIHNKFVDFQMYNYDSFAHDLIFFIFTSVQISVVKTYLDELLKLYHEHFIKTLETLKCPTNNFSYFKFLKEIDDRAHYELEHIMFMSLIIFADKNEFAMHGMEGPKKENYTEMAKQRVILAIEEFGKRGWI